jgi:hypothetical protein
MRHLKTTHTGNPGIRSESNGPVEWGLHRTDELYSGSLLRLPYKKAKPYSFGTYSVLSLPDTQAAVSYGIIMPSSDAVACSLLKDRPSVSDNYFTEIINDAYAVNGALENAQAYGQLLMMVSAAEAKDTVKMIRKVFIRFYEAAMAFYKHIRTLNIVGTLKEISALWLEFRYGWRPLALEAKAVYEQLNRIKNGGVLSSYGVDKQEPDTREQVFYSDVEYLNEEYHFEHTVKAVGPVTVKSGFNYVNKQQSRNKDFAAIWGLDWQSIASTVWELIPFSVFIDMFFNIGNLLQARDVHDQVDSFNGWQTFTGQFEVSSKLIQVGTERYSTLKDVLTGDEIVALGFYPEFGKLYSYLERFVDFARESNSLWFFTSVLNEDPYSTSEYRQCESEITNIALNGAAYYRKGYHILKEKGITDRTMLNKIIHSRYVLNDLDQRDVHLMLVPSLPWGYDANRIIATVNGVSLDAVGVSDLLDDVFRRWFEANAIVNVVQSSINDDLYKLNIVATGSRAKYKFTDEEAQNRLKYTFNLDVLQRILREEFKHSSTADVDLAIGQWADLAALAMQFFARYRNLS